jgi:serine/threonine protein kinase
MTERDHLIDTAVDGKYHVERLIGEGGMASVYAATSLVTGRRVALKLVHPRRATSEKMIRRFQREARIVAALKNPHITEIVDTGTTVTGLPYIVMEYLEGRSLSDLVRKEAPIPPRRAAQLVSQALLGLQAAHEEHVVHRDLKPENIYLTTDGSGRDVVKLLDFGVSKLVADEEKDGSNLTEDGALIGTPNYMSPEQALGAERVSTRSDIYSMGVVLYELLTAHLPFDATNRNALIIKILMETPRDPRVLNPSVPKEIADTVAIAMARDPARRFATCAEFRDRLLTFTSAKESVPESTSMSATVDDGVDREQAAAAERRAKRVYDAVFVGLWPAAGDIALQDGAALRILSLSDASGLPALLEDSIPHLIVSTARIDLDDLLGLVPDFRSPVILVDLQQTHRELAVHEWSPDEGSYTLRRASLTNLALEINGVCSHRWSAFPTREEIEKIRFCNRVDTDDGALRIETGVRSRDAVTITTSIWRGGQLVDRIVQTLKSIGREIAAEVDGFAEAQHSAAVEESLGGRYSS